MIKSTSSQMGLLIRRLLAAGASARPSTCQWSPHCPPPQLLRGGIGSRWFSATPHFDARITVQVPSMAESITEGTIASLSVSVGDNVEVDDELATIETDKIDVPVNTPQSGIIKELLVAEGDVVEVGQDVAILETADEGDSETAAAPSEPRPAVSERTIERVHPERPENEASKMPETETAAAASSPGVVPGERVVKASRMRLAIARNLKEAQNTYASTTTYQEVDMSALLAWRNQHRDHVAQKHGVRLGYMGAFTQATSMAAKQVPELNATLDLEAKTITYRDFVNVGIAVSTSRGLVTPVVRGTQDQSIVELEKDIAALATKARDSKLVMEDLEGGHYSISNPGIFGSLYGTPLIPLNQVAVFNMNSIRERVVPVNGKIEIRPMMIISLTYDHRLIDGLEAVKFVSLVRDYIQNPDQLRLE